MHIHVRRCACVLNFKLGLTILVIFCLLQLLKYHLLKEKSQACSLINVYKWNTPVSPTLERWRNKITTNAPASFLFPFQPLPSHSVKEGAGCGCELLFSPGVFISHCFSQRHMPPRVLVSSALGNCRKLHFCLMFEFSLWPPSKWGFRFPQLSLGGRWLTRLSFCHSCIFQMLKLCVSLSSAAAFCEVKFEFRFSPSSSAQNQQVKSVKRESKILSSPLKVSPLYETFVLPVLVGADFKIIWFFSFNELFS